MVRGLKAKEKPALSYLYDNYANALNGIIRRFIKESEVAEELLQDAFIKVFTKIELYDAEKGRLYSWMANLTRNLCLDHLKSKAYKKQTQTATGDEPMEMAFAFEHTTQHPEYIGIQEVVNQLPPELTTVIQYAYFKGYTQQEISEELDLPLGTVKTRMRRALMELRNYLN